MRRSKGVHEVGIGSRTLARTGRGGDAKISSEIRRTGKPTVKEDRCTVLTRYI
jgi:hypothetical protein